MKTLERKYSKSERIIAKAKFSSGVYLGNVVFALLLGGAIAAIWIFKDAIERVFTKNEGPAMYLTDDVMRWVLLGAGLLVLLSLIIQSLSLFSKELIVTEDKVVIRTGLIAVKNATIPLIEIVIIETNQNLLQRLLNMGTLVIVSDAVQPYKVKGVRAADRLTRRIMKQVSNIKRESEAKSVQLQLASYVSKKR